MNERNWNRIITVNLTGFAWLIYALLGYPLGEVPTWLATLLWINFGFSVVRVVAAVAYVTNLLHTEN